MAEFFSKEGRFSFPDVLFPVFSDPGKIPDNPLILSRNFDAQYKALRDPAASESARFTWADRLLHFAELYSYSDETAVEFAKTVVITAAGGQSVLSGHAAYLIGNWYLFGTHDMPRNPTKAREYFKQAIKRGFARAWYRMAANAEARGDITTALSRYQNGVKRSEIACMYRMGMAHFLGQLGVEKDLRLGLELFERSSQGADEDFPQPAYLLGKLYLGEMPDLAGSDTLHLLADKQSKGIALMERAASLGFSPALLRMSSAYQGPEKGFNCAISLRYLHLAARQERFLVHTGGLELAVLNGEPEAQLVKWLLVGYENVVAKNEEWAYKFAKAAADLGNGTAQFALGYFAEVGIACEPNRDRAIEFYTKSAANKCSAAASRLEGLTAPVTRTPSLRRTLTRKDHESTLKRNAHKLVGAVSMDDIRLMAQEALTEEERQQSSSPRAPTPAKPVYPQSPEQKAALAPVAPAAPYPVSPARKPSTIYPTTPEAAAALNSSTTSLGFPDTSSASKVPKDVQSAPYPADAPPADPPYPSDSAPTEPRPSQDVPQARSTPYPAEESATSSQSAHNAPYPVDNASSSPQPQGQSPYPTSPHEGLARTRTPSLARSRPSSAPYPDEEPRDSAQTYQTPAKPQLVHRNSAESGLPSSEKSRIASLALNMNAMRSYPELSAHPRRAPSPAHSLGGERLSTSPESHRLSGHVMPSLTPDKVRSGSPTRGQFSAAPPKRGEVIKRKPVDRVVSVPTKELEAVSLSERSRHNRSRTAVLTSNETADVLGSLPRSPLQSVPESAPARSSPMMIPTSTSLPRLNERLNSPSFSPQSSPGTSRSPSPVDYRMGPRRDFSSPVQLSPSTPKASEIDKKHKRTRSMSPIKLLFGRKSSESPEQHPSDTGSPSTSGFEVLNRPAGAKPLAGAPALPPPPALGRAIQIPEVASNSGTVSSRGSHDSGASSLRLSPRASHTSLSSNSTSASASTSEDQLMPLGMIKRRQSPNGRAHRRGESVDVLSSSPHAEPPAGLTGKRMVSMPVLNENAENGVKQDFVRRPGVAYSFEEMGIKTVTHDDGTCVVQ